MRSYNATELTRMLESAGLTPMAFHGDFHLAPFSKDARRLIILSKKGEA